MTASHKDMLRIADSLGSRESSAVGYDNPSRVPARNLVRRTYTLRKAAVDAMASTTTAYTAAPQIRMPRACRVLGAYFQPEGTAAADDTDYITLEVVKGDGAAGSAVICASKTTKTTGGTAGLAAGVTATLALAAAIADTRIPAGSVLGFALAKGGAGKVTPIGTFTVDVEEEDVDGYAV